MTVPPPPPPPGSSPGSPVPPGWSTPEVRPVGRVQNADGSPVVVRRRHPVRLTLGILVSALGLAVGIGGIVVLVRSHAAVMDAELARSTVGSDQPVTFEAAPGGRHPYTIWIAQQGIENSEDLEDEVASTTCTIRFADGTSEEIRGAFQSTSVVIGDEHSIGWFDAPPGDVALRCGWSRPARSANRTFMVTPGMPDTVGWPIMMILGGSLVTAIGTMIVVRALRQ